MEEKKFGIKDTKEMLVFLFTLGKIVKEAKENDGKIDYMDAMLLMKLTPLMGPAFDGAKNIVDEVKDIDEEEAKELIEYLASEAKVVLAGKEELVAKIVAGLEVAQSINKFIQLM